MFDTSATLGDLLIRVAEADDVASYVNPEDAEDNRARPPTDPHNRDVCLRAINDAQKLLYRAQTRGADGRVKAHQWRCLKVTVTVQLNVEGVAPLSVARDPKRYKLPLGLRGAPLGDWRLGLGTSSTFLGRVKNTAFEVVRRAQLAEASASGQPTMAACQPSGEGQDRRQIEVWIFPAPAQNYTMEGDFVASPYPLVENTDRHIFGSDHDEAIYRLAVWVLVRDRGDDEAVVMRKKAEADEAVQASVQLDLLSAPRSLPPMVEQDDQVPVPVRMDERLYINGVEIDQ